MGSQNLLNSDLGGSHDARESLLYRSDLQMVPFTGLAIGPICKIGEVNGPICVALQLNRTPILPPSFARVVKDHWEARLKMDYSVYHSSTQPCVDFTTQ